MCWLSWLCRVSCGRGRFWLSCSLLSIVLMVCVIVRLLLVLSMDWGSFSSSGMEGCICGWVVLSVLVLDWWCLGVSGGSCLVS